MLEIETKVQLKEEFILYKLDIDKGMFWLFNIENGDSFKLNEMSYLTLSMIDGNKKVGEIRKYLIDKYKDVNTKTIVKDFNELMQKMGKENILKEEF